jgi:branched-chain amino acid aminotransferase
MKMRIKVRRTPDGKKKPKPVDESKLGFGKIFSDHMFTMKYSASNGWHEPFIGPYKPLSLDPAAMCFHYGQEVFEGMKAYRGKNNAIYLFRPYENARRMNRSAERLCMPGVDEELFVEAVTKLVLIDKDWIPAGVGTSLYIRPTMVAAETALGVQPSSEYLFFVIIGPVGAYYPEGFSPTKIYVMEDFVRSAPGGTGQCKAAGNYAASLAAGRIAHSMGYTQVLWLDAIHRKYVEEVGTSNIFFVIGETLITPPLGGTILPGITRDSVLRIAHHWGLPVEERPLSMDEIVAAVGDGRLREAFASGTAAVVSPIGMIYYRGDEHLINNGKVGSLTERFYNEIIQIQYGDKDDPFGWRVEIAPPTS